MRNKHPDSYPRSLADYSFLFGIETREVIIKTSKIDDPGFLKELEHCAAWFRVHHDIETKKTRTGDFKNELEIMQGCIERLLKSLDMEDPLFFTALSNIDLDLLLELRIKLRGVREGTESALRSIKAIRTQSRQILFSHRELAASLATVLDAHGLEVTKSSDGTLSKCLGAILREAQHIEIECGQLSYSIVAKPESIIRAAWNQIEQALEGDRSRARELTPEVQEQKQVFERELTTFKIKTLYQEFHDALREDSEAPNTKELSDRTIAQVAEILKLSPDDIRTALGENGQISPRQ